MPNEKKIEDTTLKKLVDMGYPPVYQAIKKIELIAMKEEDGSVKYIWLGPVDFADTKHIPLVIPKPEFLALVEKAKQLK